mgnify:CR=1 FL=1
MKIYVLCVFVLMYVLIVALPKWKAFVAGGAALLCAVGCLIGGAMTGLDVLTSIDFNVVLMLLGIMITVGIFSDSNMPNKLADGLMQKVPNGLAALVLLSVLSGVVSAFIDNVATVLMFAPIGLAAAKKMKVSPIPVIISIAVSSNLQGAATLVGDTTSIMLGGFANMGFMDFFFLDGKPSIFWAVEIGALLTVPVLMFVFRKTNGKLDLQLEETIEVKSVFPTVLLLLNIVSLIVLSFVPNKIELTNGITCIVFAVVGLIWYVIKNKKGTLSMLKESVDTMTIFFLLFLFIVIAAVEKVGIIADISSLFVSIGDKNVFLLYTLIVFASVAFSAVIDNIPYVATMLPVISGLAAGLPSVSPYLLYFGLLSGATLGGNITPVGASANVVGIGILQKEGYQVKNSDFFKIGIPFTLVAVLGSYLFVWFVWGA